MIWDEKKSKKYWSLQELWAGESWGSWQGNKYSQSWEIKNTELPFYFFFGVVFWIEFLCIALRLNTAKHTFLSSSLPFFFTKLDTCTKRQKRERSLGSQEMWSTPKGERRKIQTGMCTKGSWWEKEGAPQWRRKGKEEEWSWILQICRANEKLLRAAENHKQGQKDCCTAECAQIHLVFLSVCAKYREQLDWLIAGLL